VSEVISVAWEDIVVSSKILGHISAGIYRSTGGALKELVSNAFDANATRVVITTNWPSFDILTAFDNGTGMTLDKFRQLMKGGIGESSKRLDTNITSELGRPIIGWLGIGMMGIAQICHEFKMISHHRESETAFQATIKLVDYLREKIDTVDLDQNHKENIEEIEVGQFAIEKVEYDPKQAGTHLIASDMRSAFVRKFRENPGLPLPSRFPSFLETIHQKRSAKELGDYWQMVWELAIACPIPYVEEGPFQWQKVKASSETQTKVDVLKQSIKDYHFEVVVDGLSLRKPNSYPYPTTRRNGKPMSGQLFWIDKKMEVYGRDLELLGYLYMQDGQAIEPMDLRGLLIRIRNVAIGTYDLSFLKYPKIEGPRFNWLSGEVFIQVGLEHALNIDRDSFNEMHPHFVKLQQIVHDLLREVFLEAGRRVKDRSQIKRQSEQKRKMESLKRLLNQELNGDYEISESEKYPRPLEVDISKERVLINSKSPLWPKAKRDREIAKLVAIAFEVSMQTPTKERRERFYKLLSHLLSL
jgi:hypothetical protein